ncbi:tetratricopeptide repeat protein [Iningainema tapete]|uniref:Tetratricopeptide repeat protein n=1 Tax=Iningainema tapete BLCC-T55 TaxID=2748662 RepID=A0A8J6XSM4_9CYAN|nr:tetratricopeptide repeat protein [Iningainema tapete]MBD2776766.1 tetratricopeptide repeat protein [Iningainema tapete BLCC-T55]
MKSTFLSRFTPSLMAPETLEAILVQRHQLADDLVEVIRESAQTANKHFRLLVGMRGIGKTHMIALIYHRVSKMEDLRDKLLIAWLREEEWGVTSFLDLLLRIFRAFEKEYPAEYNTKLNQQVEALYQLSQEEAEFQAAVLLREFVGKRTLLLLMENLDDLFDGLSDIGQKQLRAYIQNYSFITILATAQSLFDGVRRQDDPFYGFFYPHSLKELTLDEAVDLLRHIARLEEDKELESFIQSSTGRDRIKAIHHLAGGNHRIYVILSQFLTRKSLDELVEPFMQMLDDLTPYYQARMVWLSLQQRKIIEFLSDRRHAITVKEIAQRCFITHQTASSQLKDLREKCYVTSHAIGRESFYELQEPLMRFCLEVKKQRGEPIRLFVDFLRLWYTRQELQERLELLPPNAKVEREYVLHALRAIKHESEDPHVAMLIDNSETYLDKAEFFHALQVAQKLVEIRGHSWDWLNQGYCLDELGRYEEALVSYDKAIELDLNNGTTWFNRGVTLEKLERYEEALASYDCVIELDSDDVATWKNRGWVLKKLERYEEALALYDWVIELDSDDVTTWKNRGWVLGKLERYEEALVCYDKLIKLYPFDASDWKNRGWVLKKLERYEEALSSYNQVIELDPDDAAAWKNQGWMLGKLERYEEALSSYNQVIELDPDDGTTWRNPDWVLGKLPRRTESIVYNLFKSTQDQAMWNSRIKTLIELYDKHQVSSALAQGLVPSIPTLMSEIVSDKVARTWLEIWQEIVDDRPEFQIPLRLLNAAVRYRETKGDQRVLLELPIEERKLLQEVLGIKEW